MKRLVWLGWAMCSLVALAFAILRGRRLPFSDDWDAIVPALLGRVPANLAWAWSQQNEHRLLLLRVGEFIGVRVGGDFRAPIILGVLLLSLGAAVLILIVRDARGHTSLFDLALPLTMLRLSNSSLGWGGQLHFIASTVLSICVWRWGGCVALLLLPLCGANGLLFAVPFALYFLWRGTARDRAWCVPTLFLCALYFVGWQRTPHAWPGPTLVSTLTCTLHFIGAAVSPALASAWPLDATIGVLWIIAIAVTVTHPRLRAFLALEVAFAVVMGLARGGRGWLPDLGLNYASLALGLCAVLVVATLLRRAAFLIAGASAVLYVVTTVLAFASPEIKAKADSERAVLEGLHRGEDPTQLAARYHELFAPSESGTENVAPYLKLVR
jgi:hypothetical protein